jgi:hypothetical protein
MMNKFNLDAALESLWDKIECHEIKTSNNLRLALEEISAQSNLLTLKLLVAFREWLLARQVELITEHGSVSFKYL